MKIKLFWKENCPACPQAKELVADFDNVEYFNVEEAGGLAEASFHGILATPSIVVVNKKGEEVSAWLGQVPPAAEIEQCLMSRVTSP